ncbi:bifunctional AP-4-A phosphorylase/ADP sulfurylase [Mortierella polycephala]|uniref:Bifunctional AP-4-A phosphorylase/ADP sulfurylase n=1 Tax=Mortierella polycephala TaxID=41804 RepID=A0A9P6U0G6_9FUNG|nr:bifunctional AP-4-A phosphorylase/ADP sulfurylase [Mortierella polycephala]
MVAFLNEFDTKLSTAYKSALASGELIFTPSHIHTTKETEFDIDFQICYAPLLAKKPHGVLPVVEADPRPKLDRPSTPVVKTVEKTNPFLPHSPALYVADASKDHKILLNKYCIVPRHFLVVTKDPLSPEDMLAVWNTLKALRDSQDALAFYNCGTRSGASQPHKHLQVIPLEEPAPVAALVREYSKRRPGKKENRPGDVFSVPFNCINHVILLPDPSKTNKDEEDILTEAYITLMDAMMISIREYAEHEQEMGTLSTSDRTLCSSIMSSFAYNWILTRDFMMIVPRKQESSNLVKGVELNINSLGFAGMVLAKTKMELDLVEQKGVMEIVAETGFTFMREERSAEEEDKRREQEDALEKQMKEALSII